ncbi:hypothetical protein KIPB_004815 [Kipferlia bialata]|uniref:Uncharacterized protein n=1 Tax=Kipferlia bialata TaxID=797122 RepID=A0A9K3CUD0_9EUKA|nr:hypothetical protein KIPB_004815 [Kipferlia bialata]|eukprot:g4815.t1
MTSISDRLGRFGGLVGPTPLVGAIGACGGVAAYTGGALTGAVLGNGLNWAPVGALNSATYVTHVTMLGRYFAPKLAQTKMSPLMRAFVQGVVTDSIASVSTSIIMGPIVGFKSAGGLAKGAVPMAVSGGLRNVVGALAKQRYTATGAALDPKGMILSGVQAGAACGATRALLNGMGVKAGAKAVACVAVSVGCNYVTQFSLGKVAAEKK